MTRAATTLPDTGTPLVVDLDGTLIYSDTLWEALLLLLKQQFWQLWRVPLWLLRGKAGFKAAMASRVQLNPATLPYDHGLLRQLSQQRAAGRTLVLATGAERRYAEAIAAHTGVFDEVLASDGALNLTAANKAEALNARYGEGRRSRLARETVVPTHGPGC